MMNNHMKAAMLRSVTVLAAVLATANCANGQQGHLDYDPVSGNLALVIEPPAGAFTAFELTSRTAQFLLGLTTDALNGGWDVYEPSKLFRLAPNGFYQLDYGPVLSSGLPVQDLANDLCVDGALLAGGPVDDVLLRSGGQTYSLCGPNTNPLPTPAQVIPPAPPKPTGPAQPFFLDYDPDTRGLSVVSPESIMTTLEIQSTSGLFTGATSLDLQGPGDIFSAHKLFKLHNRGFQSVNVDNAITSGTTGKQLADDLCYAGSIIQGGKLGEFYVRAEGTVHPGNCGAPRKKFDVATSVELAPNIDIGVVVDPNGGNLIVHVPEDPAGASKPLTQIEISATQNVFLPGNKLLGVLDGPSDLLTDNRLVKVDDRGFGTIDFGPILRNGEALGDLGSVLSVTATFAGGEAVDAIQYVNLSVVPEPSSATLLWLCLPLLLVKAFRYANGDRQQNA